MTTKSFATVTATAPIPCPVATPSAGVDDLRDYVFTTKYARWSPAATRRETYAESVDRVMDMHVRRYGHIPGLAPDLAEVRAAMKDRLIYGSQRAMQFGGKPIEEKHARMYNCTVSYCDRPQFFNEAEWLLLCGCGVGFSVQHHHIDRLPSIAQPTGKAVHRIDDTIEGWSDAIGALVSGYFTADQPFPAYAGKRVTFDASGVRPKGAKLSSGNAKAPGPEPLLRSLEAMRSVMESRLDAVGGSGHLRPIDAYDMIMHASNAVLSGGQRRSATICVFSPDDHEMASAKTGDWFLTNPQRGRSNNSALLLRDETSYEQFSALINQVKEFGEPGFVWADNRDILFNPCVEIGMYPVDTTSGRSGWAFCNLSGINMKACNTEAQMARAARTAAVLGTLQAGFTEFPYLGETTERIVRREALLGVSMTGMMDNPSIALDPMVQRRMATLVLEENRRVAEIIGINPAARTTCVKPEGTTSCIMGTASGIHPHHAGRYFRTVQANTSEAPGQYFQAHNPRAVQSSVWNPNGTDWVLSFPVEVAESAKTKDSMTGIDLLKAVVTTQQNWVAAGKRETSQAWLSHNVSNTITVKDDEWDEVARFIFANRAHLAGVSLLPATGDLEYPQAPFTEVWTHDQITNAYGVGAMFASGLIVDGLHAFRDDLWAACDCALGRGQKLDMPVLDGDSAQAVHGYRAATDLVLAKKDWVRRSHKFADNYFNGDRKRMTHCLKRVHYAKAWEDITREWQSVDYTLMPEARDTTKAVESDTACGGGKCEIITG
jgi:ribonucleoside-triphosphate reductase